MDFTEIDKVHGDALNTGDVVCDDDGDFLLLRGLQDDDGAVITYDAENLTNPDGEDSFLAEPHLVYFIYQAS